MGVVRHGNSQLYASVGLSQLPRGCASCAQRTSFAGYRMVVVTFLSSPKRPRNRGFGSLVIDALPAEGRSGGDALRSSPSLPPESPMMVCG